MGLEDIILLINVFSGSINVTKGRFTISIRRCKPSISAEMKPCRKCKRQVLISGYITTLFANVPMSTTTCIPPMELLRVNVNGTMPSTSYPANVFQENGMNTAVRKDPMMSQKKMVLLNSQKSISMVMV